MVSLLRGEVALCDLNPVVGSEQAGIRPVLVLQIDRANFGSPHTIIAPFTSKIKQTVLPSHVLISAHQGGLTQDSVLLCEQIRVVDKRRITKALGQLSENDMKKVGEALKTILGL
jgi:mRNA interferase MazF